MHFTSRLTQAITAMSFAALFFGCSPSTPPHLKAELAYQQTAGAVLGKALAQRHKGARCAILRAQDITSSAGRNVEDVLVKGLKEGIGETMDIVAELELRMESEPAPDAATADGKQGDEAPATVPIGVPVRQDLSDSISRLLARGGEYDILLVCTPLPAGILDADGTPLLPALKGKRIVLAAGFRPEYESAVSRGILEAALTVKDDAIFGNDPCPADLQEAFDKRYRLIFPAPRQEGETLNTTP